MQTLSNVLSTEIKLVYHMTCLLSVTSEPGTCGIELHYKLEQERAPL